MKDAALFALASLLVAGCSSAPAKDVPPIAEEIDTAIPIEKPEAPTDEDEYIEEEPIEETVETDEGRAFDCATAPLIPIEVVKAVEPQMVELEVGERRLIWFGDLNRDETEDLMVQDVDCPEAGCGVAVYVQCPSGAYYQAYNHDAATMIAPSSAGAESWSQIQLTTPDADGDGNPELEILEWNGSTYVPVEE